MLKKYTFNSDVRMKCKYRSFGEVSETKEWKADNNKYVFERYLPYFPEGFPTLIMTAETIEELVAEIEKCTELRVKVNSFHDLYNIEDSNGMSRGIIMLKTEYDVKKKKGIL